ncbi:hypothetical protein ACI00F_000485 [Cronobacter dublinensis]
MSTLSILGPLGVGIIAWAITGCTISGSMQEKNIIKLLRVSQASLQAQSLDLYASQLQLSCCMILTVLKAVKAWRT